MNGQHISEEDLTLYSLLALTGAENAAVEAHLRGCAECRQEVATLSGDLALLALSVPQEPVPAGARERFLSRIAAEPRTAAIKGAVALDASAPRPEAPAYLPERKVVVPEPRRRNWIPILVPWAAAFAMLAVAGYLGRQNQQLNDTLNGDKGQIAQLSAQASQAQELMEALTSPSAQKAALTEGNAVAAPSARASYLPQRGALIFVANNLKPIPASKTYELWIIPANGQPPVPAGLFRPDANGTASVVLPKLPVGVPAKAFGVTIENAEGATSPTLPIVLSGAAGL